MSSQAIEALYATGHWLLSNARHKEAAEVFRVMALSKPDDERAWLALGACHEAIGQKRLAIELYAIASEAAARALRARDRTNEADDAFESAYELATTVGDPELAELALQERRAS